MSKFIPTLDRVLVRPIPVEEKTTGGIILAQTDTNATPTRGVVVAVGPGRWDSGVFIGTMTAVGDKVMWSKFSGSELSLNGEKLLLMRESDLIGKLL
jgi:chaperonin GroES